MPAAPDPMADTRAPASPAEPRTAIDNILEALKSFLPAVSVSIALPLVLIVPMPADNEKIALTLIGGLFGFLTGRATQKRQQPRA